MRAFFAFAFSLAIWLYLRLSHVIPVSPHDRPTFDSSLTTAVSFDHVYEGVDLASSSPEPHSPDLERRSTIDEDKPFVAEEHMMERTSALEDGDAKQSSVSDAAERAPSLENAHQEQSFVTKEERLFGSEDEDYSNASVPVLESSAQLSHCSDLDDLSSSDRKRCRSNSALQSYNIHYLFTIKESKHEGTDAVVGLAMEIGHFRKIFLCPTVIVYRRLEQRR
jgi:hypothetical protein